MNTLNNVYSIFNKLYTIYGIPIIELNYKSDFELLIAVILSSRTTDHSVNVITDKLFKFIKSPDDILKLNFNFLKELIRGPCFYNRKTIQIIQTCKILVKKFNSQIPGTREDLEKLPGVGRKTANIILNVIYNQSTIPVDTHVSRVSQRIGLVNFTNNILIEKKLLTIIPKKFLKISGALLLKHGKCICKPRTPICKKCIISKYCSYYNNCEFVNL